MSWLEELLNKPIRKRAIGVGETGIEKINLSGALCDYLIEDGNLSPDVSNNMATEEMLHALMVDGSVEIGALLNLFGRPVGGVLLSSWRNHR